MLAVINGYTGDQAKLTLQVGSRVTISRNSRMYAIRRVAKWTVVSCDKLPSVAEFIKDVKLAIGTGMLERKRMLAPL